MKKIILVLVFLAIVAIGAFALNDTEVEQEMNRYVTLYNGNMEYAPPLALKLFGSERMNVQVTDGEDAYWFGLITEKGVIVESQVGNLTELSMNVYTTKETIDQLETGELAFLNALNSKRIRYEPIKITSKIKMGFARFFLRIFS